MEHLDNLLLLYYKLLINHSYSGKHLYIWCVCCVCKKYMSTHRRENRGGHGSPTFYNISIGISFLPYKSILSSLCAPPDLNAFLHSCVRACTSVVLVRPCNFSFSFSLSNSAQYFSFSFSKISKVLLVYISSLSFS